MRRICDTPDKGQCDFRYISIYNDMPMCASNESCNTSYEKIIQYLKDKYHRLLLRFIVVTAILSVALLIK